MMPLQNAHIAAALSLAIAAALAAYAARALTRSGAVSAVILGTIIAGLGGWRWAAALLTFFVTSSALSFWRKRSKDKLAFEKTGRRDAWQVWANSGVAALCAFLPFFHVSQTLAHMLFLAAVASANADTWATEIGAAYGGMPFMITTGRRVPPGVSGAVSRVGIFAALMGAALLGLFGETWADGIVITSAGWGGALFDSVLGATLQAQWSAVDGTLSERPQLGKPARGVRFLRNDAVNFSCTAFAATAAIILWTLTRHGH